MKKLFVLCAAMSILPLAACQDASAKLSDSNAVVMTIGNTTITKGTLYTQMFASAGDGVVVDNAISKIASSEVEVTDDLKESAETTLGFYTSIYGDSFTSYLKSAGLTEDEYLETVIIPSLQKDELKNKYIEENFDTLVAENSPVYATVLTFSTDEDANKALSALNDGSMSPEEAAKEFNSSSTGKTEVLTINTTNYDAAALAVARSNTPDDGWTIVPSASTEVFYLVRVESNDVEEFKDECVSSFKNMSTLEDDTNKYFFKKYNFHVYDIDLYNRLKETHPDLLVQK